MIVRLAKSFKILCRKIPSREKYCLDLSDDGILVEKAKIAGILIFCFLN